MYNPDQQESGEDEIPQTGNVIGNVADLDQSPEAFDKIQYSPENQAANDQEINDLEEGDDQESPEESDQAGDGQDGQDNLD